MYALHNLPSVPPYLDIDLTNQCNAKCAFCSTSSTERRRKGELTSDEWLEFFKGLAGLPIFKLSLLGGEPLMVPGIVDIISIISSQDIDCEVSTNGFILTEKMVSRLISSGISSVQVSLDGPTAELHDRSRGIPGCFDRAINGMRLLSSAGVRTTINFVVMKSNLYLIQPMIDLAEMEGINLVISEFKPVGFGRSMLNEILDVSDTLFISGLLAGRELISGSPMFASHKTKNYCSIGLDRLYISEVGDVFPCDLYRDRASARIGNIRSTSIQSIWQDSSYLFEVREFKHTESHSAKNSTCGSCGVFSSCRSGCLALSDEHKESPYAGDPRCFID